MATSKEKEKELAVITSANLRKLIRAMDCSPAEFARFTGIGQSALSNYIAEKNTSTKTAPRLSVGYLSVLPSTKEIEDKGIRFKLGDLFDEDFAPVPAQEKELRTDYIGSFICYFFDPSKAKTDFESQMSRRLRFGVMAMFEDYDDKKGGYIGVKACFFDPKDGRTAEQFKQNVDEIFANNRNSGSHRIRSELDNIFEKINDVSSVKNEELSTKAPQTYKGDLSFSGTKAFVSLKSEEHNDHALIVINDPDKRTDSPYIGGLGVVASVSHGAHVPTAQKIIISRHIPDGRYEEIGKHLNMTSVAVSATPETKSLTELCKSLYSGNTAALCLDENDKSVIIENRIIQLVQNYIDKNICSVGCVSSDEEKAVYSLIKKKKA